VPLLSTGDGVILSSLEVPAVLFSPFCDWLSICVVVPSEDGHNLTETCKGIHINKYIFESHSAVLSNHSIIFS
jgi:hypothetical protein